MTRRRYTPTVADADELERVLARALARPLRHGTRYHYRKGCRCDECTAANRRHQQEQQARRGAGRANPGRPPVERGAVRCSCGQQCKDRTALGAHTWSAHDRWPTDAERVIIAEQVAA